MGVDAVGYRSRRNGYNQDLMTEPTSTPQTPESVGEPSSRLVRQWAACALVAAVARFVPVPLLDDAVATRATRLAVSRTLRAHGRKYPVTAVKPLWAAEGGGIGRFLASVPRRVLLFPVRKYTKIAGAVTGVPNDISRVLLLGRATHRRLALGELSGTDAAGTRREAEQVREAFDAILDEMDLTILRGAISDGIGQVKDLTGAVVDFARDRFTRDDDEAAAEPEGTVAEGAEEVEGALRRPEVVRLMAEFDRRLDERLRASGRLAQQDR